MSKHTQGPYKVVHSPENGICIQSESVTEKVYDGKAFIDKPKKLAFHIPVREDANLMAAAPRLYEAVCAFMNAWHNGIGSFGDVARLAGNAHEQAVGGDWFGSEPDTFAPLVAYKNAPKLLEALEYARGIVADQLGSESSHLIPLDEAISQAKGNA